MSIYNGKNMFQFRMKQLIRYSLLSSCIISFPLQADIYFSAKIGGPIVNIHSIDEQGVVNEITENKRWRDVEHHVSVDGLVGFSSNRKKSKVILEKRLAENYNIFLLDPVTNQVEQITKHPAQEQQPQFSPSGTKLAFIRADKTQQSLIIYDIKNKKEKTLATATVIYNFTWSPNSENIAFTSQSVENATINIVDVKNLTGKAIVRSDSNNKSKKLETLFVGVSWSPDGTKIAYINHPLKPNLTRTLHIYNIENKQQQLISPVEVQVQAPVNWSKNSQNLLYSALVDYQQFYDEDINKKVYLGGMQIFSNDLRGNNQQMTNGDHLFKHPVYSPDQSQIAYLYADKLQSRTLSLMTMKVDGSAAKTLNTKLSQRSNLQWR